MSDFTPNRLKVSREGVILIKSFEGFRPRAVRRDDGVWVIGYGHTRSAREGLSVAESDAELLLQYDLIPVVETLNAQLAVPVNQHQFDALASFAFSLGVERFVQSDVLRQVNAGADDEAADALFGWPETAPVEPALRRRAAERALFVAAPDVAVTLADLLAAPLPLPRTAPEPAPSEDPRASAVAHLLGESDTPSPDQDETSAEPPATPSPAIAATFQRYSPYHATIVGRLDALDPQRVTAPLSLSPISIAPAPTETVEPEEAPAVAEPVTGIETRTEPAPLPPPAPGPWGAQVAFPEASRSLANDPFAHVPAMPAPQPEAVAEPEPEPEPVAELPPEPEPTVVPESEPEPAGQTDGTPPADAEAVEPDVTPVVIAEPTPEAPTDLVLTPLAETDAAVEPRPIWSEAERQPAIGADQEPLFEDGPLTLGPVMRHEADADAPRRFDWSETGAFLTMGGIGLVSFGAAMAAFRRAAQQPTGGDETAMIGWVLSLIALICVGVSTFNLYQRWGRTQAD